jgi:hypothetical protein
MPLLHPDKVTTPLQVADDHAHCHDLMRAMHFDAPSLHPDKVTMPSQAADDH